MLFAIIDSWNSIQQIAGEIKCETEISLPAVKKTFQLYNYLIIITNGRIKISFSFSLWIMKQQYQTFHSEVESFDLANGVGRRHTYLSGRLGIRLSRSEAFLKTFQDLPMGRSNIIGEKKLLNHLHLWKESCLQVNAYLKHFACVGEEWGLFCIRKTVFANISHSNIKKPDSL